MPEVRVVQEEVEVLDTHEVQEVQEVQEDLPRVLLQLPGVVKRRPEKNRVLLAL